MNKIEGNNMQIIFKILLMIALIVPNLVADDTLVNNNDVIINSNLEELPDAILKDLDKKKVSIASLIESRPTLISFWFLACEPCKKEMKYLDEFNIKYADSGFQVISINTDGSRALSSVKPFVNSKKYSFRVLSDPRSKYQRKLKGTSCPFTVMVDHNGNIISRHVGYNPGDEKKLEEEIIQLIDNAQADTLYLKTRPKTPDSKSSLNGINSALDNDDK
tara:strand:+ start:7065 stop:7721 length:657 start_codon:yes stop_codon:yes gene_type:complete